MQPSEVHLRERIEKLKAIDKPTKEQKAQLKELKGRLPIEATPIKSEDKIPADDVQPEDKE